ncbi:glycosyltransferase family 39 protein [Spirulina subsalsa FACHB-351]|uniref:Glycosyltransferase family 39 protein n=1 Tax=Spirulina subsalsa FACHB-351 TaxID=234711 RepID=A0ABT3L2Q0_9CYAN|nr:glycosyltransferase family 39 protein [Spirulina subsalsa]MCW6035788.1 glycosyltransferase family 39 protein [Spirulina subsalsa FACHB-351]
MKASSHILQWVEDSAALILLLILALGSFLRLYGINFGLPNLYNFDEIIFVDRAYYMLGNQDPNPHWFGAPASTTIYLLVLTYILIFAVGMIAGQFSSPSEFKELYLTDPTIFYLSGRLVTALFGIAMIILVYGIGRKLFNSTVGLIGAAVIAFSPLCIYLSKLIRMDIQMTVFLLLSLWFCLQLLDSPKWRNYILAGLFLGLAITTKYPAIIFTFTIILAHFITRLKTEKSHLKLGVSALSCVLGTFVSSPFLFLDIQRAWQDIIYEGRSEHLGSTGQGFLPDLIWYWREPILSNFTIIGALLSLIGLSFAVASKRKDLLIFISFPVLFFVFIASLGLRWDRWIIPVFPFLALLIGYAIYRLYYWIKQRFSSRISQFISLALLGIILLPLANISFLESREMAGVDTRTLAGEWMLEHIPPKSAVLVELYTPQLPKDSFQFFEVNDQGELQQKDVTDFEHYRFIPSWSQIGNLNDIEQITEQNIDYIVMSNMYDRFAREKEQYLEIVKTYEVIMQQKTLVYETERVRGVNDGPNIRIYRVE